MPLITTSQPNYVDHCQIRISGTLDSDSGLIAELTRVVGSKPITVGYATDASVFQALTELDCAIIGPGDIAVCHKPKEYIEKRQLSLGIEVYRRILTSRRGMLERNQH